MAPVRREGPRAFACTIRDISERKQTERELHESKRVAEEEAEIASALLYAGETLSAHLNQPYMVDRLTCRAANCMNIFAPIAVRRSANARCRADKPQCRRGRLVPFRLKSCSGDFSVTTSPANFASCRLTPG